MSKLIVSLAFIIVIGATIATLIGANKVSFPNEENVLNTVEINDIDGKAFDFKQFQGQVIMLVNVASKCGFTPQYEGLEELYQKYKDQGFVVIAIPSNDFAKQEPGSGKDIKQFCQLNYGVSFPILEKVKVIGENKHPLFEKLVSPKTNMGYGGSIKWNFTKFLLNRQGKVIDRFAPFTKPQSKSIQKAIEKALNKK